MAPEKCTSVRRHQHAQAPTYSHAVTSVAATATAAANHWQPGNRRHSGDTQMSRCRSRSHKSRSAGVTWHLLALLALTLIQLTHATSRTSGAATTDWLTSSHSSGSPAPERPLEATSQATITATAAQTWTSHLDQPSAQPPPAEEAAGEDTLGFKVNRSLTLLETGRASDAGSSQMRRLLVRELTSLIMNNEPEIIAQNVRGARVSGQMVSESSGLASTGNEGLANSSSSSSEIGLLDGGHAVFKEDPSSMLFSSDLESPTSADIYPEAQQQQQHRSMLAVASQDALQSSQQPVDFSATANGGQTPPNTSSNTEEQYVTCPPDYEDQTLIEAAGNLTTEQQQQLLASADSSGILNANSSLTDPASTTPQLTRPPGQCVHPGSRMIEMITKVITPILFSIIIVVGLVGNIIVMLVIIEDRKTERELTPTNLLILDLSLADLSFIIFCIPFTGWDYSVGHWVFGLMWCKFNQYLIVVCALSSIYTLVLMSVDRFLAIVYPIECISYRTSKNTLYAIYIKWILILLMASPTILMHGLIDLPMGPDTAILYTCRFLSDQFDPLQFQIIFFITSYLFPLILIFCLYLSLLNKLWFGSKPHGHKESQKMLDSKKRVTMLVASIVVVFALCWCPIQVMLILMRLKSHKITVTYVAIQVFAHILGYMNSCVNPIVYAFASETFHNSFKRSSIGRIFCLLCCCSSSNLDTDRPTVTLTGRSNSAQHTNLPNSSLLNHLGAQNQQQHQQQPQHQQQHQQQQQQQIQQHHLHQPNNNGQHPGSRHNSLNVCHDSTVSTTTLLMTSYNSTANDNVSKIVTLPLEPRDRDLPPPPPFGDHLSPSRKRSDAQTSLNQTVHQQAASGGSGQVETSLEGQSQFSKKQPATTAKQQLVVRVVQSNNQISHQCKPCYQQELIAP